MFGTGELVVILGVTLVLFGGKKLPEFARNLGIGIREFKKACNGEEDAKPPSSESDPHEGA
jgi:sec-independent protein translocase protein TatA